EEASRISRVTGTLTATVQEQAWLTDPASPNYVAHALRDPNTVKLLALWPAPNIAGTNQFVSKQPGLQNTRQEVGRVDYDINSKHRLTGRYTHDNSFTEEPGGLFQGTNLVPNVWTTDTNVPGQIAAAQVRSVIGSRSMNEFQFQFSSNTIGTVSPDGTINKRSQIGLNIPELFPQNAGGYMPLVAVSGLTSGSLGASQLYNIEYRNYGITDSFTTQRG